MTTITYITERASWGAKQDDKPVAMAVQRAIAAVTSAPVPAPMPAPCGIVDDGYADSDHTSRWIARMERCFV